MLYYSQYFSQIFLLIFTIRSPPFALLRNRWHLSTYFLYFSCVRSHVPTMTLAEVEVTSYEFVNLNTSDLQLDLDTLTAFTPPVAIACTQCKEPIIGMYVVFIIILVLRICII